MPQLYLSDFESGQNYAIEVRARRDGNIISPWSQKLLFTPSQDDVSPGPPTDLVWEDYGTAFSGTWSRPLVDADGQPLRDLKDYEVTVIANNKSQVYYTTSEVFDFSHEMNEAAFGEAQPSVLIEVRSRDHSDNLSEPLSLVGDNEPPGIVTGLTTDAGIDTIYAKWNRNPELDVDYYELHASTSGPTFVPSNATLRYSGNAVTTAFIANTGPWYLKIRAVDRFQNAGDWQPETVTASPLGAGSAVTDTVAPATPTGLALTASLFLNGQIRTARVTATWTPPNDDDLAGYNLRIRKVGDTDWDIATFDKSANSYTFYNMQEGVLYEGTISAFDKSGNVSAMSNIVVTPTVAEDTTPPASPVQFQPRTMPGLIEWRWALVNEPDIKDYKLEISTIADFTNIVETVYVTGGSYSYPIAPGQDLWARVYARDIKDLESSAPSNVESTTTIGIPSTYIASLEANKITAGTGLFADLEIAGGGGIRSTGFNLSAQGLVLTTGTIDLGTADTGFHAESTGQFWSGGLDYNEAKWRVGVQGDMRVGPATARTVTPADTNAVKALYIDNQGNMWSGHTVRTSAPWNIDNEGLATFNKVKITAAGLPSGVLNEVINIGSKFIVSKTAANAYQVNLAGNLYVDAGGDIQVATGNLTLNGGNFTMSGGTFDISSGTVMLRSSNMELSGGTLKLNGGQITAGTTPTTAGMTLTSTGLRFYKSGTLTVALLTDGTAQFKGDITGATGAFTGTVRSGQIIVDGAITGPTYQTSASGARVVINGSSDSVTFYNSSGTSSTLRQGFSSGLETSGSLRVGGDNATGTAYAAAFYVSGSGYAYHPGNHNHDTHSHSTTGAERFGSLTLNGALPSGYSFYVNAPSRFGGQLVSNDGSNSTPVYSFNGSTSSGMYYSSGVSFSYGGTAKVKIATNLIPTTHNVTDCGTAAASWAKVFAAGSQLTSDARLKDNVRTTDLGLDFVLKVNPVSFTWNNGLDGYLHNGFIAQDIEKTLAEFGHTDSAMVVNPDRAADDMVNEYELGTDEYEEFERDREATRRSNWYMAYNEMLAPAYKAIQDMYSIIEDLRAEVAALRK